MTADPARRAGWADGGPVDHSQMRAANMGLILRALRSQGPRSRARLAADTGLSKAAMTTLIAWLSEHGLVREGAPDRDGSVGRPGLRVSLDGRGVVGVGVEISVDYLSLAALDLRGEVLREFLEPMAVERLTPESILERVAAMVARTLESLAVSGHQVVGVFVSPPGIIDYEAGTVRFAPNLGWRNVPVLPRLADLLGDGVPPLRLENDAKIAAVAEFARHAATGVQDLVYLTGDVGVGAGIIAGGRLMQGWSGFSGEIGHLPLDPEGRPCRCGRRGCWERIVGLEALLGLAAAEDDPVQDLGIPLQARLAMVKARAEAGEPRTLSALETIVGHLARGLGLLVDVLNPEVIVLGGYYSFLGDLIRPPLAAELARTRMDEGSRVRLVDSALGLASVSRGGALAAIEAVFNDPSLVRVPARRA